MGAANIRKGNGTYPKGHQTSPHGNTSNDASVSSMCEALQISKSVLNEIPSHITDVMSNFEFQPDVIVVEIEGPTLKFDDLDPAFIRTLSDGRRVFVNPNAGTDEFILRHTTQDILTITKLYAQKGVAALLVFSENRYGLLPLAKFKAPASALIN